MTGPDTNPDAVALYDRLEQIIERNEALLSHSGHHHQALTFGSVDILHQPERREISLDISIYGTDIEGGVDDGQLATSSYVRFSGNKEVLEAGIRNPSSPQVFRGLAQAGFMRTLSTQLEEEIASSPEINR